VYPNVEVDSFDGLLVDYATSKSAHRAAARNPCYIGLRIRATDGPDEPAVCSRTSKTIFMMANETYSFISSRLVKEVVGLGGSIFRSGAAFG